MFKPDKPVSVLTPRELTVVRMVCESLTSVQIAEKLGICASTVEAHRTNIYKKLNVDNVVQLMRWAIRQDVVRP